MTKILLVGLFLLAFFAAGYWWWKSRIETADSASQVVSTQWQDRQKVTVTLKGQPIVVELVTTPASITLGLGGRSEIGADGMLFVLPHSQKTTFWMKGMQFDLDLIWIANGKVAGVTPQVLAEPLSTPDEELALYPSPTEVDMVLEIPAGKAAKYQIVTGDNLELR